jgi:hypothetical protein
MTLIIENYNKIEHSKQITTSFAHKSNSINFNYFMGVLIKLTTDCVKDLVVMLDGKPLPSSCSLIAFSGTKAIRTKSFHHT